MNGEQSSRPQWYLLHRGGRTRMSLGRMEFVNGPPNNFFQLRDPIPSRRELHQRILLLPSCDRTPPQNCVGGDTSGTNADHESASVGPTSASKSTPELASVDYTYATIGVCDPAPVTAGPSNLAISPVDETGWGQNHKSSPDGRQRGLASAVQRFA